MFKSLPPVLKVIGGFWYNKDCYQLERRLVWKELQTVLKRLQSGADKNLQTAFTHDYANEHRLLKISHNERLEFLDSILQLLISEYLYKNILEQRFV